jgi:hypothetical protein
MSPIKYRIPRTTLYLSEDGVFSPKLEPGEEEVPLTRDHAAIVSSVYAGRMMQTLSNKSEDSGLGISDSVVDFFDVVSGIVSVFTYGIDVFEIGKKLNDWLQGVPDKPDPLFRSLQQIHESLKEIKDFELASWVSNREDNIAFLLSHSATALQTANLFIQARASRTDPVWAPQIAIALRDTALAVNTFAVDVEGGYWRRPHSIAAISVAGGRPGEITYPPGPENEFYGWMPHIPDRAEKDSFGRVWDYRWALPALIYTLVARAAVIRIFASGSAGERRAYCAEMNKYANVVERVFMKMTSGIRTLDRLSPAQQHWYRVTGKIPLVTVDLYGGYYLGGYYYGSEIRRTRFPPGLAPSPLHEDPVLPEHVDISVGQFAQHWWNLVAIQIGLPDLLSFIGNLRSMCDKPWFPLFYNNVHDTIRYVRTDVDGRKLASTAANLVKWSQSADAAGEAKLTASLFTALQKGGDRTRDIMRASVRELVSVAANTEGNAPSPAPAKPARPRKKKSKRR